MKAGNMSFYHRIRAVLAGKRVYCVITLKRMCFATSLEQCKAKFTKQVIASATPWQTAAYVIFNEYVA